jgi:peroxiredoxin Q/BCP
MTTAPETGKKAPPFDLPTPGGDRVSLKALKGRWIVLYFYPNDDTTGCTQEALSFSEKAAAFEAKDAIVIGVSRDSLASHAKFKAKHALNLTLASDEDGACTLAYGVWVEKSMYGKKYFGIERSSFLIGPDGRIVKIWRKVKVAGHADEVLKHIGNV